MVGGIDEEFARYLKSDNLLELPPEIAKRDRHEAALQTQIRQDRPIRLGRIRRPPPQDHG